MTSQPSSSDAVGATVIRVTTDQDVTWAWQEALRQVDNMAFTSAASHHLATSVSELAQNLVKHATEGGRITLAPICRAGIEGVEVTAEDHGPGIEDVPRAMEDGYSTNGGLGGGLPAVRRLMDEFEITSTLGTGTRVVARIWKK